VLRKRGPRRFMGTGRQRYQHFHHCPQRCPRCPRGLRIPQWCPRGLRIPQGCPPCPRIPCFVRIVLPGLRLHSRHPLPVLRLQSRHRLLVHRLQSRHRLPVLRVLSHPRPGRRLHPRMQGLRPQTLVWRVYTRHRTQILISWILSRNRGRFRSPAFTPSRRIRRLVLIRRDRQRNPRIKSGSGGTLGKTMRSSSRPLAKKGSYAVLCWRLPPN
jgi:hypothetical protein